MQSMVFFSLEVEIEKLMFSSLSSKGSKLVKNSILTKEDHGLHSSVDASYAISGAKKSQT